MKYEVPQEIIDKVINTLGEDAFSQNAILTCTLVSRGFYGRANHHIFSNLSIVKGYHSDEYMERKLSNLLRIFQANPMLASRVQVFTLDISAKDTIWNPTRDLRLLGNESLPIIFYSLKNLQHLYLTNRTDALQWSLCNDTFVSSISHIFALPSLTSISLEGIASFSHRMLANAAHVKNLSLVRVTSPPSRAAPTFSFRLQSLRLDGARTITSQMIKYAKKSPTPLFSTLKSLIFYLADCTDILTVEYIFGQAYETLDYVELIHAHEDNQYLEDLSPFKTIGIEYLLQLSTIKFHIHMARNSHVLRIPNSLCGILDTAVPGNSVTTVEIHLSWKEVNQDFDPAAALDAARRSWSTFDAIIASPNYDSLANVIIRLDPGSTAHEDYVRTFIGNRTYLGNKKSAVMDTYLPLISHSESINLQIIISDIRLA